MKNGSSVRPRLPHRMMLVGLGVAALYWILESVMQSHAVQRSRSLVEWIFAPEPDVLLIRALVVCPFVGFGLLAQHVLTQRTRVVEELQNSERQYGTLATSIPGMVYRGKPDWSTEVVAGSEAICGYSAEEFNSRAVRWLDIVHPEDREKVLEEAYPLDKAPGSIVQEYRITAKDGDIRWVEDRKTSLFTEEGSFQGVNGAVFNITERKQAEEAVRLAREEAAHSRRLLLALSQAAQAVQRARTPEEVYRTVGSEVARLGHYAIVFSLTGDQKHLMLSHATFESFSLQVAEKLTGLSAQNFRFPIEPGSVYERVLTEQQAILYEVAAVAIADSLPKSLRPVAGPVAAALKLDQAIFAPMSIDGVTGALLVVAGVGLTGADVSGVAAFASQAAIAVENAHALEALRESERRFRSIIESLPMGVHMYRLEADGQLCFAGANPAADEILGVDNAQYVGKTIDEAFPEMSNTESPARFRALAEKGGFWKREDIVYRDELVEGIFEDYNFQTSPGEMVSLFTDITERKRAEKEIRDLARFADENRDPVLRVARDGTILYANEASAPVLDEWETRVGSKAPAAWLETIADTLTSDSTQVVELATEGRIFSLVCAPVEAEGYVNLYGRDITASKQALRALHLALEETAHSQRMLLALSQAAQGLQRARTPDDVYRAICDEIGRLGYAATVFTVTDDRAQLAAAHMSFEPGLLSAAERLTGLSARGYRLRLEPGGFHERIMRTGKSVFRDSAAGRVAEALPGQVRPPAGRLADLLGLRQAIYVPMQVGSETQGLLAVVGAGLTEADVPAMETFAHQAAVAIENARLFERAQRYADEMGRRVAERTRELTTLYEVTAVASESLDLAVTLERSLELVLGALGCRVGAIQLVEADEKRLRLSVHQGIPPGLGAQLDDVPAENGLAGWVLEQGETLVVVDLATDLRAPQMVAPTDLHMYVGAPMRARGHVVGVLSVFGEADKQLSVEDVALVASVADHAAVAVENARLREQGERLAVAEERERLARELHDSLTQSLYSVVLFADAGLEIVSSGQHELVREHLSRISTTGQHALTEMRLMVYQLRPTALGDHGLVRALQHRLDAVEERSGMRSALLVEGDIDLDGRAEEAFFGIAQEALNNALKHSGATVVTVRLRGERGRTDLEVADDGRGFDPDLGQAAGGTGLATMRERAERIDGTLTISAAPGEGTVVRATVAPGCIRSSPSAAG